ncbi:MAG: DUF4112 domain-containing protein [Nitrospiraceae bacterium]
MDSRHVQIARFLAYLLDSSIPIPGTAIRIGLDPLIGLIPGLGDAIAGLSGTLILLLAGQQQVPKIVLARMAVNIALNSIVGAIPVVGDLFSAWFKSNLRNVDLLERHTTAALRPSTAGDWAFVLGLAAIVLIVVGGIVAGIIWLLHRAWQTLNGSAA